MLALLLMAQGGPVPQQAAPPQDRVDVLAMDLRGGSRAERRYAARELLRQTRATVNTVERRPADSLESLEARQTLGALQEHAVPACMTQLTEPTTLRPCARILTLLDVDAALPLLAEAQLQEGLSGRNRRALARAESTIQEQP